MLNSSTCSWRPSRSCCRGPSSPTPSLASPSPATTSPSPSHRPPPRPPSRPPTYKGFPQDTPSETSVSPPTLRTTLGEFFWYNNCWLKAVALHNCLLVRVLVIFPPAEERSHISCYGSRQLSTLDFFPKHCGKTLYCLKTNK